MDIGEQRRPESSAARRMRESAATRSRPEAISADAECQQHAWATAPFQRLQGSQGKFGLVFVLVLWYTACGDRMKASDNTGVLKILHDLRVQECNNSKR